MWQGRGHPRPLPRASSNCARRDPFNPARPGGALRVTSAGAWHSCPAITVEGAGCSAGNSRMLGVGPRHPREMGLGEASPRSRLLRTQVPSGLLGRASSSGLPTWKAVPRRVVKGLPGVGPGEGLPSLPLKAWRPLWVRSHSAPGSTPVGSYMGSVGGSLPSH